MNRAIAFSSQPPYHWTPFRFNGEETRNYEPIHFRFDAKTRDRYPKSSLPQKVWRRNDQLVLIRLEFNIWNANPDPTSVSKHTNRQISYFVSRQEGALKKVPMNMPMPHGKPCVPPEKCSWNMQTRRLAPGARGACSSSFERVNSTHYRKKKKTVEDTKAGKLFGRMRSSLAWNIEICRQTWSWNLTERRNYRCLHRSDKNENFIKRSKNENVTQPKARYLV